METNIDLKGIVRKTANPYSPAGSMHEMINLRKIYGSWRPILRKLAVKENFAASTELFIHSMDEVEYYITYNTNGYVYALTDQGVLVETLMNVAPGLNVKFNSIGDFLIINDLTNCDKYIFRYFADLNPHYKNISDIPFLNMSFTCTEVGLGNEITYNSKRDVDSFQAGWYLLEADMREQWPEYFEGYVFVRYAIELIDGTTLKHSLPVFLYSGHVTLEDHPTVPEILKIIARLFALEYTIQTILPANWDDYKNLIRGISIFMSKPVSKYDLTLSGVSDGGTYLGLSEKPNLLIDLFRNESAYYRIHHIPFNKILGGETGTIGTSKPITSSSSGGSRRDVARTPTGSRGTYDYSHYSGIDTMGFSSISYGRQGDMGPARPYNPANFNVNDILSYDMLNVDDISHHTIIGFTSLNYNSRLFMGDIYTKLFNGYNITYVIVPTGGAVAEFDIYIEVDLNTSLGLKTVRQTMKCSKDAIIMPYIFGYPDYRATEIRILHNSGGTLKKSTFALESHPLLNLSFATKLDGVDLNVQAKNATGFQTITIASMSHAATLATLNTSLRDKNRVQVTELYNPFIMPAINSYQVGEGNIVALSVNVLPLEDRFGTFPVFVFSSRGIWSLNLSDTGSIVVSNIVPLSNAVCTNGDSCIVVDNLLVFLASDGIKLLTGQIPAEISDLAETTPLSTLNGDATYLQIKQQVLLNDVTDQLCSVDLLAYSTGAQFAFNKKLREIIISNYNYKYSWIYSLDEKVWYKCSQRFKKFVNNYPNTYALSTGNDLVNVSEEQTIGDVPVYIESKPILLGPEKEIKIARMIFEGRFDVATSFNGAVYIFGSNDSSKWSLITGKEISGRNVYNIIIPRFPISLRYMIFIFSGTITQGSAISNIKVIL